MKKLFCLVVLSLLVCCSAFAMNNESKTFDESVIQELNQSLDETGLDLKRWRCVSVTGRDLNQIILFDKRTVTEPFTDTIDVWKCNYYRGKHSCDVNFCINKKVDTTKHFHFHRWRFDLRRLQMTLLSSSVRNEKKELVYQFEFTPSNQAAFAIEPESVAERTITEARKILKES